MLCLNWNKSDGFLVMPFQGITGLLCQGWLGPGMMGCCGQKTDYTELASTSLFPEQPSIAADLLQRVPLQSLLLETVDETVSLPLTRPGGLLTSQLPR